jgi:hypothetical protein
VMGIGFNALVATCCCSGQEPSARQQVRHLEVEVTVTVAAAAAVVRLQLQLQSA